MSRAVWMLTTYPLWYRDGYATRVNSEVELLRARGHNVNLVCVMPLSGRMDPARRPWLRDQHAAGIEVHEIVKLPDRRSPALRRLADAVATRRLRRFAARRGVRLLHAQGLRAAALASLLPDEVKVVVDIHGDPAAEARTAASASGGGQRARVAVEWAEEDVTRGLQRADARVVVSHAMADWASTRSSRPAVTELVPCAVDVTMFRAALDRRPVDALRVCYLGGLQAYQSPAIVADAAAVIAGARTETEFWVVTPGDHAVVRSAFAERGLEVTVEALDRRTIGDRLTEADVGIVPRRDDPTNVVACPTKIGEYLAAGVPVLISSSLGRWPENLRADGVGESLDASTDALRAFLDDVAAHRTEYARRCRDVAERGWSWGQAIASVETIYDRVTTETA